MISVVSCSIREEVFLRKLLVFFFKYVNRVERNEDMGFFLCDRVGRYCFEDFFCETGGDKATTEIFLSFLSF